MPDNRRTYFKQITLVEVKNWCIEWIHFESRIGSGAPCNVTFRLRVESQISYKKRKIREFNPHSKKTRMYSRPQLTNIIWDVAWETVAPVWNVNFAQ